MYQDDSLVVFVYVALPHKRYTCLIDLPLFCLAAMNNRILLIAHAPLAHALRECARHVFPDCATQVLTLDVVANADPQASLEQARALLDAAGDAPVLLLTDVFGATPHNVAQELAKRPDARLVTGVNLPMLLRSICYAQEPLDSLAARAVAGGTQGILQVTSATPQNQNTRHYDPDQRDHQQ